MSLKGTMSNQIEIKAVGDLFHESIRDKPNNMHGKRRAGKEIIEHIDEEKKSIKFKVIEGDLMELYKSFIITHYVDDTGVEYEKLNEGVPDPTTLMQLFSDD